MKASIQLSCGIQSLVLLASIILSSQVKAQKFEMAITSSGEILSGGPSSLDAQKALQDRISDQSRGRVKLVDFRAIRTNLATVDLKNEKLSLVEFESCVEFGNPCKWAIRFNGKPLTFKLLEPNERATVFTSMPDDVISVSKNGERYAVIGSVWFALGTNGWASAGFASAGKPKVISERTRDLCILNLRRISGAFAAYQLEHKGQNPFNISTNENGSLELCARGPDGYDKNTAAHFRAMSELLSDTTILVCPADSTKEIAKSFQNLTAKNVSYILRSGTDDQGGDDSTKVLLTCPTHSLVLYSDGNITGTAGR